MSEKVSAKEMNLKLKIGILLVMIVGIVLVSGCVNEKTSLKSNSISQTQQNKTISGTIQLETGMEWNGHPSFSPDGGKIVFTTGFGVTDIHILSLSDRKITKLVGTDAEEGYPAFSPDGEKIVFHSDGNITIINVDGSGLKTLTDTTNDYGPRFSPDGREILFTSHRYSDYPELWVMNAEGSNAKKLADLFYAEEAEFSPDEDKIVFVIGRVGLPRNILYTDITVMNSDGTGIKILTNDTFQDNFPEFSPDGKSIVFNSIIGVGKLVIRKINTDGGELVQLKEKYNVGTPSFSPDGTKLAYAIRQTPHLLIIKDVKDLKWKTIKYKPPL